MPTALVLGGYGLIGSACVRALANAGFRVIGVGRSRAAALQTASDIDWAIHDVTRLTVPDWSELLVDVDVVVNAAGALQDGPRDDLEAIHAEMPKRVCASLTDGQRLVQISAAGVSENASTQFFRSKARGDAHVRASGHDWVILRPTLVLSPDAYGGTGLLRGAAALPVVLPAVLADAQIQTVHVDDLANAVVAAASGRIAAGTEADITEPDARSQLDLMRRIRAWQGFSPARITLPVPDSVTRLIGRAADLAGHLGWRSPLRTTALLALKAGVTGDPADWRAAGGLPCRGLDQTLVDLPSTRQERLYARLYFALPLAIVVLSAFWIATGVVTLFRIDAAAAVLAESDLSRATILALVIGGSLADIALGVCILWRPWCRQAALGMIALSLAYLAGGTVTTPGLWLDPLGPLVKVLPSIVLALVVWLGVEER